MEIWALIIIIVLILAIVTLFVFFGITTKNNYDLSAQQILYPFSAVLNPSSPTDPVTLLDGSGNNQITCPAGSKINIVGAFFDIADPYGMCTPSPSDAVSATCGGKGTTVCSAGQSCGPGMTCEPSTTPGDNNSYCVAMPCNDSTTLPANSSTTTWICNKNPALALTPAQLSQGYTGRITPVEVCNNLNSNFQNNTCANGANNCAPRDASAYLAKACNGQQTCSAVINNTFFGPYPCGGPNFTNPQPQVGSSAPNVVGCTPPSTAVTTGYCSLPYAPGTSNDFKPSSASNPADTSFTQGYMVHGLYTCVPN